MVRDVNEPFLVKQTQDPVYGRVAYYETTTWGSGGGYATGGVNANISTLARVVAAVGPTLNTSGGRWLPKIMDVSATTVRVGLFGTTGGSGDALTQAATGTATSGVLRLSMLVLGD